MAHTPGPWVAGVDVPASRRPAHLDTDDVYAASPNRPGAVMPVCRMLGDMACGYDNARLIAAAPELLRTLRLIAEDLDLLDRDTNGWRDMDATVVDQLIASSLRRADDAIAKATGEESE